MKKKVLTVWAIISVCLYVTMANAQSKGTRAQITVKPHALLINLQFSATIADSVVLKTTNQPGQPDYHKNISEVLANAGNKKPLEVRKKGQQEWVVYNKKQPFSFSYTVTSPKQTFMGNIEVSHFHPTLFKDFVFAWGNYIVVPQDTALVKEKVTLKVNAKAYPDFFVTNNSFPSYYHFTDVLLIGGKVRHYKRSLQGKPVHFIINGNFKFPDTAFVRVITKVLEAQIKYMGMNPQQEPLLITLTEGSANSSGGTVVKNAISVYPNPSSPLEANQYEFVKLIAHENFHLWNGRNVIVADNNTPEGYYKWFSEGFTDYYAALTLYRENFYTSAIFINWINGAIQKYISNPYSLTGTPELMKTEFWKNSSLREAAYNRGSLLGLLFDLRIKQMTQGQKDLDDLMRLMIKKCQGKFYKDEDILASLQELTQHDWKDFYNQYILGTAPLPFIETFKEINLDYTIATQPVFDLGFTTESGQIGRNDIIKSVIPNSNAEKAGLKTGDILKGFDFYWYNTERDASFTVERQTEKIKVSYRPNKKSDIVQVAEEPNNQLVETLMHKSNLSNSTNSSKKAL